MSFLKATSQLPMRTLPRVLAPRLALSHRFASTSRSTSPVSPLTAAELSQARQIDWSTYLSLRKSQRLYGLIASVPTTLIGFLGGASYFATLEADPTVMVLGIQLVYIYGIATIACVGLGWLAGPLVGGTLWKAVHRKSVKSIEAKDKAFFAHIVKNRADASRTSLANPIPDYYAEKVGSLKDYRHWLRDQRTFMRKVLHENQE